LAVSISHNPTQSTGIAALIEASHNNTPASDTVTSIFGEDGFTFGDIIDIINPLQHIPIVNSIYRNITGDTIEPAMKIAGGALFGGPLGAIASIITTAFQSRQSKVESADPNSPYMDKESQSISSTNIANNAAQQLPQTISSNDYSSTNKLDINKTDYNNKSLNKAYSWVLSSENIAHAENTHVSINMLQDRPVYQPRDGITNIAYNAVERYTEVITSNQIPSNSIDITIGASIDSG